MKPESGGGRIYTWGNLALSILLCCLLGAQAGFRERKLSMGRKRQTDFSEILSALVPSFSPLHSLQSLPYRRKEKHGWGLSSGPYGGAQGLSFPHLSLWQVLSGPQPHLEAWPFPCPLATSSSLCLYLCLRAFGVLRISAPQVYPHPVTSSGGYINTPAPLPLRLGNWDLWSTPSAEFPRIKL